MMNRGSYGFGTYAIIDIDKNNYNMSKNQHFLQICDCKKYRHIFISFLNLCQVVFKSILEKIYFIIIFSILFEFIE